MSGKIIPWTGAILLMAAAGAAQAAGPSPWSGLSWRLVGPYRGGRVDAVAGVAGKPNLGYFGSVGGGVFETTDAGVTWQPLFQHEPVASIGSIAVAASDPAIIYVGTGESTIRSDATYGDGIWRSADGGKTWQHVGLADSRHIGRLIVNPNDPNTVLVSAMGHLWGPNAERGVFRTTDGGQHWTHTLSIDDDTGAVDLARDPVHPNSVYAVSWNVHRTPWFQYSPVSGAGSAIYHSTDDGVSWQKLAMKGLPGDAGRIGIAVADTASGPRLYAIVTGTDKGGVYRSDDGGADWRLMNDDERLWGRGWYFGRITADPKNPDVVYVPNTSLYRSTDGGKTFTAIKGSPNGDDLQRLWVDPENSDHLITTSDQGASVSLDDGAHWSSWFNQPTAQIYHIGVDDRVPYWIYGTQQDSGALAIPSRSPNGIIANDDWHPVGGGGESGYIFPKKGDPTILYGSGFGGDVERYNQQTQLSVDISPASGGSFGGAPTPNGSYFPWNTALAPSPFDADALYVGGQVVFKTSDGGDHWHTISPILTRKRKDADCKAAPTNQTAAECGYSVIYALALSPAKRGVIWAGTDDGLMWRTEDGGKHWHDVTPKGLADWSRIDTIEADPHDASSAYAAVDRHQMDDFAPYMYVTHDAGAHWRLAVAGIPRGDYVRVVRTDPERKGLLYAGTEQGVFVSFDDGRHWQSLQLNLPTASVHDLVVHGGDLVAATHGRGIWILDDIEPLREASAKVAKSAVHLYRPRPAYLFPLSLYHAEARPPEEPHAANPPTGAIIDYRFAQSATGAVQLAIYDANGRLVRRYSSTAKPAKMPPANFPDYFKAPPTVLPAQAGLNRFVWDFHYAPPLGVDPYWAGPAVLGRTPRGPLGPLAPPGTYRVVLTVNGAEYSAPLELIADPKLHAAATTLRANAAFALDLEDALNRNAGLLARAEEAAKAADKTGDAVRAKRIRAVLAQFDLDSVNGQLYGLMREVSSSAEAPTASAKADSAALEQKSERARAALAALLVPGM